jgi:predicted Fe-S protein YdhL (DUF1289 family)
VSKTPVSPCVSICALDEDDICTGCYRTASEITDWFMADDARKQAILAASRERREQAVSIKLD